MSRTIFREEGFSFLFFSREDPRMHVHVACADGQAKFWLGPAIALAQNAGLSSRQLRKAESLIETHADEIRRGWQKHYGR